MALTTHPLAKKTWWLACRNQGKDSLPSGSPSKRDKTYEEKGMRGKRGKQARVQVLKSYSQCQWHFCLFCPPWNYSSLGAEPLTTSWPGGLDICFLETTDWMALDEDAHLMRGYPSSNYYHLFIAQYRMISRQLGNLKTSAVCFTKHTDLRRGSLCPQAWKSQKIRKRKTSRLKTPVLKSYTELHSVCSA